MTTLEKLKKRKQAIDQMPHTPNNRRGPTNNAHCKAVICFLETGKRRFPSLIDAANWLENEIGKSCVPSALGYSIRRGSTYKGYKFRYEEEQ